MACSAQASQHFFYPATEWHVGQTLVFETFNTVTSSIGHRPAAYRVSESPMHGKYALSRSPRICNRHCQCSVNHILSTRFINAYKTSQMGWDMPLHSVII